MRQAARRSSVTSLILLVVAGLIVGCSGGGSEESPTAAGSVLQAVDVEFQSLQLANQARTDEQVDPQLGQDSAVANVARLHSEAMRDEGFFGHTGKNGDGLRQRLDKAGVQYSGAAENLAEVNHRSNPAQLAHHQLMASASHRKNILGSKYRLAGVGVAKAGDTYWITQIFIKP
jgi:uncharacterized protein YkwD